MNLTNINQQAYSSPTATYLAVGFGSLKQHGASAPFGLCAFFMQKINGGCAWGAFMLAGSVIQSSNLCTSITQCLEAFRDGFNQLFTEAVMPNNIDPVSLESAMQNYQPVGRLSVVYEAIQCLRVMLTHEIEADQFQLTPEQILSQVELLEFGVRSVLTDLEE